MVLSSNTTLPPVNTGGSPVNTPLGVTAPISEPLELSPVVDRSPNPLITVSPLDLERGTGTIGIRDYSLPSATPEENPIPENLLLTNTPLPATDLGGTTTPLVTPTDALALPPTTPNSLSATQTIGATGTYTPATTSTIRTLNINELPLQAGGITGAVIINVATPPLSAAGTTPLPTGSSSLAVPTAVPVNTIAAPVNPLLSDEDSLLSLGDGEIGPVVSGTASTDAPVIGADQADDNNDGDDDTINNDGDDDVEDSEGSDDEVASDAPLINDIFALSA